MDIKELTKLANHLDSKGLQKEADVIDSFVKEAGALATIGVWVSSLLTPEILAEIAEKMPAKRLAEVAKAMDEKKQKEIIQILAQDQEVRAVAFAALGVDPNLGNLGFEALKEMQALRPGSEAVAAGPGNAGLETQVSELQSLFDRAIGSSGSSGAA